MFAFIWQVQLALDALDRLVDTLEERGTLSVVDAARSLFATASISDGLACSLLADVTAGDSRVVCTGTTVSLTGKRADPLLEQAEFVVFDLETTGLSAARCQICEFGAVRVRALELVDSFQALVNPGVALPEPVARLTGLREEELQRAASISSVLGRFLSFAGDALLVAHNARFDQRFLERQLVLLHGRRLSEPPLCTAALARRLLEGRLRRVGLASPAAHPPGPASTSFATATGRCSTSAGRATCAPVFAPISKVSASGPRWRRPCSRSSGSSGACWALSSRPHSKSYG